MKVYKTYRDAKRKVAFILLLPLGLFITLLATIFAFKQLQLLGAESKPLSEFLIEFNEGKLTDRNVANITDFKADFGNTIYAHYSPYESENPYIFIPLRVAGEEQSDPIQCLVRHEEGDALTEAYQTYLSNSDNDFVPIDNMTVRATDVFDLSYNILQKIEKNKLVDGDILEGISAQILFSQPFIWTPWIVLIIGLGLIGIWIYIFRKHNGLPNS
ncbi:MAG: hypothetical protein QNK23_11880 [Crocinitomicaceae bacterium]|nr:hypothetical protein [Crocinitomicaceae bacterium]